MIKDITKNNAKKTKILYLDYSKWRCGGYLDLVEEGIKGKNIEEDTELLNNQGNMCCLGQFSLQLGCKKEEIENYGTPEGLNKIIPLLTNVNKKDTKFSDKAISINDNENTFISNKIDSLRKLLKPKGYKLVVINQPK